MRRADRLLYHQIHPLKLITDFSTAAAATFLLWEHRPFIALIVGFVPSVVVSAVLIRWADLEHYRDSTFGRYVGRFMTRRVEMARLAGLLPLWGGAWVRNTAFIGIGVAWILGCWLWGMRKVVAP